MIDKNEILSKIENAKTTSELETLNVEVLGKSGSLSMALRELGKMTPEEFFRKYVVGCSSEKAAKYRNPQTAELRAFAEAEGRRLVSDCGFDGAEYFIGGSLGYDVLLKGNFDIDLRLLLPDDGKTVEKMHREIDAVQKMLVDKAHANGEEIKCKFIDEKGTNYIQHTKQIVKLPGTEQDVELTWNIQAKSSYKSIAGLSARLPQIVRDRFVVAKGLAKAESKEAYDALKVHWRDFINWLSDNGGREMDTVSLEKLLASGIELFPLFLKEKA